eukprot:4625547-Prymnesium_polylepis.1
MTKVYAWYDDAWWSSKLGLMEGYFATSNSSASPDAPLSEVLAAGAPPADAQAPLLGRYHDGPQRCLIGHDTAGMPIYSGEK